MRVERCSVLMVQEVGPSVVTCHPRNSVQQWENLAQDLTPKQATDLAKLLIAMRRGDLTQPFTIAQVASLFRLTSRTAERMLGDLRRKGVLGLTENKRAHVLLRGAA